MLRVSSTESQRAFPDGHPDTDADGDAHGHGYADPEDYYRASTPDFDALRVPWLCLHARDDPVRAHERRRPLHPSRRGGTTARSRDIRRRIISRSRRPQLR